jgi:hypothetical protein
MEGGRVIYFVNDPVAAQQDAKVMQAIARETGPLPQPDGGRASELFLRPDWHPFRHGNAEVNVANSFKLLQEYWQEVLPDVDYDIEGDMYELDREGIQGGGADDSMPRRIVSVRFPSPEGVVVICHKVVNQRWAGVEVNDLVGTERASKWTKYDQDKRRFAFVAVVDMARKGYLNKSNKPSADALHRSKHLYSRAVSSTPGSPPVKLQNRWPSAHSYNCA